MVMMTTMIKNSLFLDWMNNLANSNFAAFSLAEMNRMAIWNH